MQVDTQAFQQAFITSNGLYHLELSLQIAMHPKSKHVRYTKSFPPRLSNVKGWNLGLQRFRGSRSQGEQASTLSQADSSDRKLAST